MESIKLFAAVMFVSGILGFAQSIDSGGFDNHSEKINVPNGNTSMIVIDGKFSNEEWEGALNIKISEKIEIMFLADSENLFVGFKYKDEFIGDVVSELYIALNDKEFLNLHSSGAPGEGINNFSDNLRIPKFVMNDNKDWDSNPNKAGIKCYGKEYRINLSKLPAQSIKFAGGIIFVNESAREWANIPEKYNFKNSNGWADLIIE